MFGLATLQALGMTRGEGLVSDKDLESRAEENTRMVVEEKKGVRVLVRDDTPTTHCREMLGNLEVRNFEKMEREKLFRIIPEKNFELPPSARALTI